MWFVRTKLRADYVTTRSWNVSYLMARENEWQAIPDACATTKLSPCPWLSPWAWAFLFTIHQTITSNKGNTMTLFQALKILLRNKEIKENLAYAFSKEADKLDVWYYFDKCSDKWFNHALSVTDEDEVDRALERSGAFHFMAGHHLKGGTIRINLSNYNVR